MSHSVAESEYSAYYKIWTNRGDLDGIPQAETGDELQARVLVFLEQFMMSTTTQIVVTHAGFIRAMINTIMNRDRTTVVDISHSKIHLISNPWNEINYKKIKEDSKKTIYFIETVNKKYVMKVFNSPITAYDVFQYNLLKKHEDLILFPKILALFQRRNSNHDYKIKVFEFLDGEHMSGVIEEEIENKVIMATYDMYKLLNMNIDMGYSLEKYVPNLLVKMCDVFNNLEESEVKNLGCSLLGNSDFIHFLSNECNSFVNYDIHRKNVIFDGEVRFIDLESIILSPKEFQLGSLISAFFMLENTHYPFECVIDIWPEKYNHVKVIYMSIARCFLGAAHFQIKVQNNTGHELENKLLIAKYMEVSERLSLYI
ncbi:hypothetical protein D3C74_315350 [compost metagenome]